MATIKDLPHIKNYLVTPLKCIQECGHIGGLIFSYLASKWHNSGEPIEFSLLKEDIEKEFQVSYFLLTSSISKLESNNYLTIRKGKYGVAFFILNQDKEL